MKTFATLFSGGEGAGVGLQAAGLSHIWGIEYAPDIAAVAQANWFDVRVADVRDVDYAALPRVDWLHASPVCTRASVANPNAGESAEDVSMAQAVVRALRAQQPEVFTLENVWQYRKFRAFRLICDELGRQGFFWTYDHVNAADLGVPQTRRRLILRASRGLLPHLPASVPWVGWYEAIEDLLPGLPDSQLAPWQLARLPDELRESVLCDMQNVSRGATQRMTNEPSATLSSSIASRPSHLLAVLIAKTADKFGDGHRQSSEPAQTIGANEHGSKAVLPPRVVSMTPRCLARFQSVPDWYELPDKRTLSARVIGNMVPPLLMQRIAENMLGAGR